MPKPVFQARTALTTEDQDKVRTALLALEAVVTTLGRDYKYPKKDRAFEQCVYVYAGHPDCIAGRTLHLLGTPLEVLEMWEQNPVASMGGTMTSNLGHVRRVTPVYQSQCVLFMLDVAQTHSDIGKDWGFCLDTALKFAETEYGVTIHE